MPLKVVFTPTLPPELTYNLVEPPVAKPASKLPKKANLLVLSNSKIADASGEVDTLVQIFICENKRPEGHPRGCCAEKNSAEVKELFKKTQY
jgi:hypothetical protein